MLDSFEEAGTFGGGDAGTVQFLLRGVLIAQSHAQVIQTLSFSSLIQRNVQVICPLSVEKGYYLGGF